MNFPIVDIEDYDTNMDLIVHVLGFPNEEVQCWHSPKDSAAFSDTDIGARGTFHMEIILGRPGHLPQRDQFKGFDHELNGDSYIRLSKPTSERRIRDRHTLKMHGGKMLLIPNDEGFAAKIVLDPMKALNVFQAERSGLLLVSQHLSAWSVKYDTPLQVDMIRVRNADTGRTFFRARSNVWKVELGDATGIPMASGDYAHYASLYREALISNSPSYRFLCFFKILESTSARYARLAPKAKKQGVPLTRLFLEKTPSKVEDVPLFLKMAYPYPKVLEWDPISLKQVFIPQAVGKSFTELMNKDLRPIRNKLAHGLTDSGEIGASIDFADQNWKMQSWLPLLRCMVRIRLRNDFGKERGAEVLFEDPRMA